jgi:hypothetical protein
MHEKIIVMKDFQLNSPIDLIGGFWPPDNKDDTTSGTLGSQGGRLYLSVSPKLHRLSKEELHESVMAFGGGTKWQRIDVLQGQTKEGPCTLLDLIESTDKGLLDVPNSLEIAAPVWRVGMALMGLHLASDEAEVLDGAAFYITKIKNMLPLAGQLQMTEEGVTYTSPYKALNYFSFKSAALEAEVICEIFAQGTSRFQSVPRVRIVPTKPRSLAWYWMIGPRLENFFSLILGTSVSLKGVQLFQDKEVGWLVKRFQTRDEKIIYANWVRCEPQQMAAALDKWLEVPEDSRPVETIVLNVLRKSSLFVETEFLSLAQALEGYGRIRFSTAHSKKKLIFADGIQQTYDLLSPDFAAKLLGEKAKFVSKVVQTRNYFTHLGSMKKAEVVSDGRLFFLNERLQAFIRCVMLIDLGIPESALREPILYQATRWKEL